MPPRLPLTATYRLQMNASFTFAQALAEVDYFAALGVSHLYLSPILAARAGSTHGYDVTDPTRLNPELGTEVDFRRLADAVHERGMGLIVDIVPNHMGIGSENPYWEDVLTHGERSRYARWFDIDWSPGADGHRKLTLPVLGDELDRVLERGELAMRVREGETPRVVYYKQSYPVDGASLPPELQLATFDPEETGELAQLFSGTEGRERLRALLDVQHYRLVHWRRGPREINYRRFFDVNDLAALHMEDEAVFRETHALTLRFVHDGVIDGLRVDHVDGLFDPLVYLQRLRAAVGPDMPIFVEKILAHRETLRRSWPVQGTTGYEYMNDVEDLFVDTAGFRQIEEAYRRMRRLRGSRFADAARAGKRGTLEGPLRADIDRLARVLAPLARAAGKYWSLDELAAGLIDFIVALPVYRTYVDDAGSTPEDDEVIERALAKIDRPGDEVIACIANAVRSNPAFARRLQQVSPPATAKGVEDTALYQYVPLASVNEVGGGPDRPLTDAVQRFHDANARRARDWPLSLTSTNTHDTKRSADLRARIDALSEMPAEWERSVRRWRRLNAKHRRTVNGRLAPDTNTEYLIYQTLVGLWPPPRSGRRVDDIPDRAWRDAARDRLARYATKAAREAKMRTSWVDPDAKYEEALTSFIAAILEPADDAPFLVDVARLVARVAPIGAVSSLARVALHLTSPGTPDTYQGDELWTFTLVDPDNRRPVDYAAREAALHAIDRTASAPAPFELYDQRSKIAVVHRLFALRRDRAEVFTRGSYTPLPARGSRAAHVVAFARTFGGRAAVTVVPRLVCDWLAAGGGPEWWQDTSVELPLELSGISLRSLVGDAENFPPSGKLELGALLRTVPVAVLAD